MTNEIENVNKISKLKKVISFIVNVYIGVTFGASLGFVTYKYIIIPHIIDFNKSRNYSIDENALKVNSLEEAQEWCYQNITYKCDIDSWGVEEYWQSPEETYTLRTGDCEDFCIMFMYICNKNLEISPDLVIARNKETNTYHCFVKINEDYYDITQMDPYSTRWNRGKSISDTHDDVAEVPYDIAMKMVYYCHRYFPYIK